MTCLSLFFFEYFSRLSGSAFAVFLFLWCVDVSKQMQEAVIKAALEVVRGITDNDGSNISINLLQTLICELEQDSIINNENVLVQKIANATLAKMLLYGLHPADINITTSHSNNNNDKNNSRCTLADLHKNHLLPVAQRTSNLIITNKRTFILDSQCCILYSICERKESLKYSDQFCDKLYQIMATTLVEGLKHCCQLESMTQGNCAKKLKFLREYIAIPLLKHTWTGNESDLAQVLHLSVKLYQEIMNTGMFYVSRDKKYQFDHQVGAQLDDLFCLFQFLAEYIGIDSIDNSCNFAKLKFGDLNPKMIVQAAVNPLISTIRQYLEIMVNYNHKYDDIHSKCNCKKDNCKAKLTSYCALLVRASIRFRYICGNHNFYNGLFVDFDRLCNEKDTCIIDDYNLWCDMKAICDLILELVCMKPDRGYVSVECWMELVELYCFIFYIDYHSDIGNTSINILSITSALVSLYSSKNQRYVAAGTKGILYLLDQYIHSKRFFLHQKDLIEVCT